MAVVLAKSAGFCFGVDRAVEAVYRVLEEEEKKEFAERLPIYTYGPIVHNERIVEELEKRGVQVLTSLSELKGLERGIVVIRAHGVGKEIYESLEKKGLKMVDSSCPFVRKIQKLVAEHSKKGESVIVMGDPEHPEIQGILGWGEGDVRALKDLEDVKALPDGEGKNIFVVAQTTFNIDKFKVVLETFKKKGYHTSVINTICNATFERQSEARELAGKSDAMVVIGGSSSSNTKKLYEICKAICPNTQLIQTVKDLKFNSDEAIRNVGITAGASTPKEIIEEVLTYVRNEF